MRLLVTGAAGGLASVVTPALLAAGHDIVLLDRVAGTSAGRTIHAADLGDRAAMQPFFAGIDAVVHLGGLATEAPYDQIRCGNLDGAFNLYECARLAKVGRVLFASSHHVIGFYPAGEMLDPDAPPRPDTLYAASKLFGEALARLYWDKYGIESAVLRIGSVQPRPLDARMMSTWISQRDFIELLARLLTTKGLGYRMLYAISDNAAAWWPIPEVDGWSPQDRAEQAADIDPHNVVEGALQGGFFTRLHPFDLQALADAPPEDGEPGGP